jgi:hypothetical protein
MIADLNIMASRFAPKAPERTPWDSAEAIRLEIGADGSVEWSGASGLDSIIWDAAVECVKAHHEQDLDGVRIACRKIEERAKERSQQRQV